MLQLWLRLIRPTKKFGVKIFEAAMLIILLSAAIHIFGFHGIVDFSEKCYRCHTMLIDLTVHLSAAALSAQ